MKIHPAVKRLVNNCFTEEMKSEVQDMVKTGSDEFIINYSILELALEDDLVYGEAAMVKEFFGVEDLLELNEVDVLTCKIITTLSNETGIDVKKEYYDNFTLDPSAPELTYLAKSVENYLIKK